MGCCGCTVSATRLPACSVHCQSSEQQPHNFCRAKKQEKAAKGGAGSQLKSNAAASNVLVSISYTGLNLPVASMVEHDMLAAALCMSQHCLPKLDCLAPVRLAAAALAGSNMGTVQDLRLSIVH